MQAQWYKLTFMHAYLITGGSASDRAQKINELLVAWKIQNVDVIRPETDQEAKNLGITVARQFMNRLNLQPLKSPATCGILDQANLLTTEAQNSLLKTLEEPPPQARIILSAANGNSLLPTIISRCQLINLENREVEINPEFTDKLFQVLDKSRGERLLYVDSIAKDEIKPWLSQATAAIRLSLITSYVPVENKKMIPSGNKVKFRQILQSLLEAQKQLQVNVNPKLIIDNVLLDH